MKGTRNLRKNGYHKENNHFTEVFFSFMNFQKYAKNTLLLPKSSEPVYFTKLSKYYIIYNCQRLPKAEPLILGSASVFLHFTSNVQWRYQEKTKVNTCRNWQNVLKSEKKNMSFVTWGGGKKDIKDIYSSRYALTVRLAHKRKSRKKIRWERWWKIKQRNIL